MYSLRPANERGHTLTDWLDSFHTFSFGQYYDPQYMGFGDLRVINDDVVAPGKGFDMHPHDNMEIISIVLSGALEHKDSLGSGAVLNPGEVQVMTAGSGIFHSEFNPSSTEPVHFCKYGL
ncbi:MAG: pirin family protein [Alphaproteobacteria bacterium]